MIDALRLDLIGPGEVIGRDGRVLGQADEILDARPSTWYLSGFLIPIDADPEQKADEQAADELDEASDASGADDAVTPERAAARVRYRPSSMGISLLVRPDVPQIAEEGRADALRDIDAVEGRRVRHLVRGRVEVRPGVRVEGHLRDRPAVHLDTPERLELDARVVRSEGQSQVDDAGHGAAEDSRAVLRPR